MTINGINIEKFGAVQLTVDMQPPQDEANVEWIDGAVVPTDSRTTTTFSTLELVLLFRGSDPGRIVQAIGEVTQLLTAGAELELDGYRDKFRAWYKSSKIEKILRSKTRRKLTLNFQGYLHGELIKKTYRFVTQATVMREGARTTPVILTVLPANDLGEITVEGLTDDPIVISNLTAGVPVTIDGRDGTAEENGINKGRDVSMWEPPTLKTRETTVRWSAEAAVTVEYWPIWL